MIESYRFGRICINGKNYRNDVLIFDDEIKEWWRVKGHELHTKDLEWVIGKKPEIIIIGTGAYGILKVPEEVKDYLNSMKIEIKIEKTKRACELYNELKDKKRVAAGFHLTC
ncbi:MAG: hypothetical protein KAX04_04135 [Methanomicrobia archaeon]|nr:hypothetical protein [Methanomicrobia archaeon]